MRCFHPIGHLLAVKHCILFIRAFQVMQMISALLFVGDFWREFLWLVSTDGVVALLQVSLLKNKRNIFHLKWAVYWGTRIRCIVQECVASLWKNLEKWLLSCLLRVNIYGDDFTTHRLFELSYLCEESPSGGAKTIFATKYVCLVFSVLGRLSFWIQFIHWV